MAGCLMSINPLKLRIVSILSIISFLSIFTFSCSSSLYSVDIGESELSFKYKKSDYIYPYSRFLYSSHAPRPPKLSSSIDSNALISVSTFDTLPVISHIDSFITYMQNEKGVSFFKVTERNTINLNGIMAEYIRYGYDGYDTTTVSYQGIFINFVYHGHVADIDILSPSGTMASEEAFVLIQKTFIVK